MSSSHTFCTLTTKKVCVRESVEVGERDMVVIRERERGIESGSKKVRKILFESGSR